MKAKYYKDKEDCIWKNDDCRWTKYDSSKGWHDPVWINCVPPAAHWEEISEADAFEFVMIHPYVQPHSIPFHKILLPMIRRAFPEMITNEICGIQPMSAPVGLSFMYDNKKKRKKKKNEKGQIPIL